MEKAQRLAFDWEHRHRRPWRLVRCPGCAWRFQDWPYTHMEAASLVLDGYPARHLRRKLPSMTPAFTPGMPF